MPVSLDFALSKQVDGTPTPTTNFRQQTLVEQIFSPRNTSLRIQTPTSHLHLTKKVIDRTYKIDTSYSKVDVEYHDADPEINLTNIDNTQYFPRCSTGIKGPRPPTLNLDLLSDDEQSTNTMMTMNSRQDTIMSQNFEQTSDYIPEYKPIHRIKDHHPIRATCFHPGGEVYVIGSNSKKLTIYEYPKEQDFKHFNYTSYDDQGKNSYPIEPEYSFQFMYLHRGSVYSTTFNDAGNLLATCSNDQTIHLIQYDSQKHQPKGNEYKLTTLHSGTIRDIMFMPNEENENSCFLVSSSGEKDNSICITDCGNGMKTIRVLDGHEGAVMSLHHWDDKNVFVSGSLDGTIRMWDVRSKLCLKKINTNKLLSESTQSLSLVPTGGRCDDGDSTNVTTTTTNTNLTTKSPVNVVRVEQTGKLLVSGHKDGRCMLFDIRGGRVIQAFKQHDDEIRTLNFSPKSYYLLTGGYDNKIKLMDLQGELGSKLPYVEIGELGDKIVQTAWHPIDYNFVTTCADGSATLWAIPEKPSPNNTKIKLGR